MPAPGDTKKGKKEETTRRRQPLLGERVSSGGDQKRKRRGKILRRGRGCHAKKNPVGEEGKAEQSIRYMVLRKTKRLLADKTAFAARVECCLYNTAEDCSQ